MTIDEQINQALKDGAEFWDSWISFVDTNRESYIGSAEDVGRRLQDIGHAIRGEPREHYNPKESARRIHARFKEKYAVCEQIYKKYNESAPHKWHENCEYMKKRAEEFAKEHDIQADDTK